MTEKLEKALETYTQAVEDSGYCTIEEWRFIENVGAATYELKKELIRRAGLTIDPRDFRESLSAKWLTAEIFDEIVPDYVRGVIDDG